MDDALEVELFDPEQTTEIRLVTELMVAAERCPSPLDQSTIDRILLGEPEGPDGDTTGADLAG